MENQKECAKCKRSEGDLLKCFGCSTVYYCGRECQKADWKEHKPKCNYAPPSKPAQLEVKKEEEISKAENYIKVRKVGDGNFSEIWLVQEKTTKEQFALKVINKQRVQQLHKEKDVLMEAHTLKRLEGSDYVIKLYDKFKDELSLYLLMDYVEAGELWHRMRSFGLIARSLINYFYGHLIKAVEYIHSKGIVHRDLKPENIMIDGKNRIKLIDFGTARDLENPEMKGAGNSAKGKRVFDHFVGTPHYMAPECVRNKDSTFKSDVWSLGCILYQFIAGSPPYLGGSEYLVFQKSLHLEPVFDDFLFSNEAKDLISRMLERDPQKRLSLEEVKKHAYFKDLDFENLPSYDEAEKNVQPWEKVLIDIKDRLEQITEKEEENIKTIIQESQAKVKEDANFSEDLKHKFEKWISMMQKQAWSHFSIKDFAWHPEQEINLTNNQ